MSNQLAQTGFTSGSSTDITRLHSLEYQGEPVPWYMTPGPVLEASRGGFPSLLLLGGPWD